MRRNEFAVPEDPPEIVIAERLENIAIDLERIADKLEDDDDEGNVIGHEADRDEEERQEVYSL